MENNTVKRNIYTVSEINAYIRSVIKQLPYLDRIYISGEISGIVTRNGITYFTLKDDTNTSNRACQLKCVMFSSDSYKLKFTPENGMKVVCFGEIDVYVQGGYYQLRVRDIQPQGKGALALAYEQLFKKLESEGLFDSSHKKPLPEYPKKIGVATSNAGAAVRDIIKILGARFPLCEVVVAPTIVQGERAGADIVKSISILDNMPDIDLIIVGRGGGSAEDLWAFNEEIVARAVYNCKTPVISAVGHEVDRTICDYVADVMASTPSNAAEIAVHDMTKELEILESLRFQLKSKTEKRITNSENALKILVETSALGNPDKYFESATNDLKNRKEKLLTLMNNTVLRKESNFKNAVAALNALSPLAVLGRGYSIVTKEGSVVKSESEIKKGDKVNIRLADGSAKAEITGVEKNGK